jgi:hypothetical protein
MGDVNLPGDEIEKRLGYSMDDIGAERPLSPKRTGNSTASNPTRKTGIRRLISPSRSGLRAMRQVSALGMEDPIFQTDEEGPAHPSNIFSDMGVADIASDCYDMVSVASDHTADSNDGLDREFFNMSLTQVAAQSPVKQRPSIRDFNPESSLLECDIGMPHMEETDHSGSTSQQKAVRSRNPASSQPFAHHARTYSPAGKKKASQQTMKAMHLSAASLDLAGVFGASRAQHLCADENKLDNLLLEAAEAAVAEGSSCSELIEAARHQHRPTPASTKTMPSENGESPKKSIKFRSVTGNEVTRVNKVSTSPRPRPRPRMMPTLSGIFAE